VGLENALNYERLPAFGRLPWLARLRRARNLRFFVFFDMRRKRVVAARPPIP
jgi:hypothetical protein